jgi:hypothetical protein
MPTDLAELPQPFTTLRDYIRHDLGQIVDQARGGNYAAALLIVVACEALGTLVYGGARGRDHVFATELIEKHGLRHEIGTVLADAVRNGLAHLYDTKLIDLDGKPIEVIVSWHELRHLAVDKPKHQIVLNVRTMWDDLCRALQKFEAQVRADPALRRAIIANAKPNRVVTVAGAANLTAWRKLFDA